MSDGSMINYRMTPTGERFHSSRARVRCVRGPVGSGKSVMNWMEILFATGMRMPPMRDGVIRAKWLVIRNTYDELKTTTVETARQWFEKSGILRMHMSPPLEGFIETVGPSGHPMEIQLLFRGMDTPGALDHLQSLEISGIFVNEACQVSFAAIERAMTRLGRYPKKDGELVFPSLGVIMDTNSPDNTNWWYKKETECPEGWEFFVQPPALVRIEDPQTNEVRYENNIGQVAGIPAAENVENHNEGFDYWRNMLGSSQETIDTLILNRFGTRKFGKPVFPEFIDSVHVARRPLEYMKNLPVVIGQDFGRTPAAVIGQVGIDGQIRLLAELESDNMSITQFVKEKLRPLLINEFGFFTNRVICFGDPAGADPTQVSDVTCIMQMNDLGIYTVPSVVVRGTRSNSQLVRINTVSETLNYRIGGEPALLVSPRCARVVREGFNGGYHYRKMRLNSNGDEPQYTDEPEKDAFSHLLDAVQYLVCGVKNSGMDFTNPYFSGGLGSSADFAEMLSGAGVSAGLFA